jgi:hypothetical protein
MEITHFLGGNNKMAFSYKDFSYNAFSNPAYKESQEVKQAKSALDTLLAQKPGAYQSQWQTQLDDTINKILNREKFSYDLNGDALYQQYKDKYTQQAKMAMGDAIGQASAMTGGYGNSYAQSVGQQQYQAQMQNLNDIVPELYQMALDKYNQEGQDLYNQYGLLDAQESRDYGKYRDTVGDWQTERDYLAGRYDSERTYDYGKYTDERDFNYGKYSDDRNLAYSKYSDDKTLAYNEYRKAIEDAQWQKEFELAQNKYNASIAAASYSNDTANDDDTASEETSPYAAHLDGLVGNGVISESEADRIYADFVDNNKYYSNLVEITSGWSVEDDGGVNWFWGTDNNAIVKAPNGEKIRIDNLVDKLVGEGMEKKDAKAAVKKLQKNLGI